MICNSLTGREIYKQKPYHISPFWQVLELYKYNTLNHNQVNTHSLQDYMQETINICQGRFLLLYNIAP